MGHHRTPVEMQQRTVAGGIATPGRPALTDQEIEDLIFSLDLSIVVIVALYDDYRLRRVREERPSADVQRMIALAAKLRRAS